MSWNRHMHCALWLPLAGGLALTTACDRPRTDKSGENAPGTETRSGEVQRPTPATPPMPPTTPPTAGRAPDEKIEGKMMVKVAGEAPQEVNYTIKGDKIRLTTVAAPGKKKGVDAIIDTDEHKATILMKDAKQYAEVDLDRLAKKAKDTSPVDVLKSGHTSTVMSRTCEQWELRDAKHTVQACVVKGGPNIDLDALEEVANVSAPGWLDRIIQEGYVPLSVTITDKAGKQLAAAEFTKFTVAATDEAALSVPKDYKKVEMPAMKRPTVIDPSTQKGKEAPKDENR